MQARLSKGVKTLIKEKVEGAGVHPKQAYLRCREKRRQLQSSHHQHRPVLPGEGHRASTISTQLAGENELAAFNLTMCFDTRLVFMYVFDKRDNTQT